MNKAFVREADSTDFLCPRCQGIGLPVPWSTVAGLVPAEKRKHLGPSCYFCETPNCPVAYFDGLESAVLAADCTRSFYPKDVTAPLCACFGLTHEDVLCDLDDGQPTRIRALLAKSKTPAARCAELSPTGSCCLPLVQRHYFRLKGDSGRER